jgi:tetratricopeptide (TPR) repeat protein
MRALSAATVASGRDALALEDRAYVELRSGRLHDAVASLREGVAVDPEAAGARADLARALQALGDAAAALAEWRALVGRRAATAEHVVEAVGAAFRAGRFDEALAWLDAGTSAHPGAAAIAAAKGAVLYALGRTGEAIASYETASRLAEPDGDPGDLFVDHAIVLCAAGRTREGAELLVARLPEAPMVRGHQQLATAALALGEFSIGWPQLEHRWLEGPVAAVRPSHALPPWKGQPLHGKTLLVRAEQGIGDTIQFSRYLPMLRERGARTLFVPLEGMEAFASRFAGVDRCVGRDVDVRGIDAYVDLMSIPGIVGTTLETIPPVAAPGPAPENVRARWAARMEGLPGRRIGLVWAGRPEHPRDRERSIPFERLAPLFEVPGIRWVSLQKGGAASQSFPALRPPAFVDLGAELASLDDLAEAIVHLDLVVSVDTAVAHLAATLGKAVWMLVPQPADCRWLEGRDDSPWYPTMRLFRQPSPGDWNGPIACLAQALRGLVEPRGAAPAAAPATPSNVAARTPLAPSGPLAVVTDSRCGLLQYVPDGSDEAQSLERYGEWRVDELALAIALAPRGGFCVEAGASVGLHAIPLARKLGPEGDLLVWEDRPVHRRVLSNNLRYHALDAVTVMARSLGRGGEGAFRAGRESLDDLAFERLDGIKVDASADAAAIVDGASETLWRCRPWLIAACDTDEALRALARRVREFGYRVHRLEAPCYRSGNFCRWDVDAFGGRMAVSLVGLPEEADVREPMPGCVELA